MISALTLAENGQLVEISIRKAASMLTRVGDDNRSMIWIDLENPTEGEETDVLEEIFHFHPLAIRDCRRSRLVADGDDHLPKVEDFGSYLFCIVNPLVITEQREREHSIDINTQQLSTFLGESYIVTHHYEHLQSVESAVQACYKNPTYFQRGPDFVNHLVLEAVVNGFTPILETFDGQIDRIEQEIFTSRRPSTLQEILGLKRQIFLFRRITGHQRELVFRLARGEFDLVTADEIAYYRNVFDHLVRATDLSEAYRDMLTALLDAYLSNQSNRLNEIMKVLALISTFFLPLTFIVGLYGMNFDFMPELGWRYGYGMSLAIMAATALAMWMYFRRRGWL